jgi:hypothetical protein
MNGQYIYTPDKRFERFRVVYDLIEHRAFFFRNKGETSDSKMLYMS